MIEAVVVCVNYLDFLEVTFPRNKKFFDNFIVITSPEDKETQLFCEKNEISLVITSDFYKNGAVFDKGLSINKGIKELKFKDWVTIMDADTILPKEFGKFPFENSDINKMYGARRAFIRNKSDLDSFEKKEKDLQEFLIPHGFAFGYLQVFNMNSNVVKNNQGLLYPSYPNARESDWMFSSKWGNFIRGKEYKEWEEGLFELPFKCISLGEDGENHFGRKSKNFT